jgi:hypothetical protein
MKNPSFRGFCMVGSPRWRKVQIRFDRLNFDRAIVYYKNERMGEARPVDFVGNDRKPSKKTTPIGTKVPS